MFGVTQSFNLLEMGSVEDGINMLCNTITTKRESAIMIIDRIQKMITEHPQQIQKYFINTYKYFSKPENQEKLKAGGDSCKSFFRDLKDPMLTDLQNNKGLLEYVNEVMSYHFQEIMNSIQ